MSAQFPQDGPSRERETCFPGERQEKKENISTSTGSLCDMKGCPHEQQGQVENQKFL